MKLVDYRRRKLNYPASTEDIKDIRGFPEAQQMGVSTF